jgi:8-oxo-dGTP diphosphatase
MSDDLNAAKEDLIFPSFAVTVDIAIFTVAPGGNGDDRQLQVLLVERGKDQTPHGGEWALPGGFVGLEETLEEAAARTLSEKTGIRVVQDELRQLRTFGDPKRDRRETADRVVTIAYAKLIAGCENPKPGGGVANAKFFPVVEICGPEEPEANKKVLSAFDHWTILEAALARVRTELEETPIAIEFLNQNFTMSELHSVYRAVWGDAIYELDPANFRRRVLAIKKGGKKNPDESFVKAIFKKEKGPNGEDLPAIRKGKGRSAALYEFGGIDKLDPPYRMPLRMPQKAPNRDWEN